MNSENSRQSLVSKERLLDFVLRANSGNCPLSNKKFLARIWQRLDNLFLMLFNSRNATHFVYLWRQFLYEYIQKIFQMANNFAGLQYFLAVFDLVKGASYYFVHSVWNMVFLTEDAIFEARGIGSDCWPRRLKFKMAETKIHSIVISSECTHVNHTIFLF